MKKISKYILASFFAANIFFVSNTHALVIDFEDLVEIDDITTDFGQIPSGYESFTWNAAAWYVGKDVLPSSGFQTGTNGTASLFNNSLSTDLYISFTPVNVNETFTFNGAYITAAYPAPNTTPETILEVTVQGLLDGAVVPGKTMTVSISATEQTWFDFEYDGIDEVKFIPSPSDSLIVIDDITINEITTIDVTIDIKPSNGDDPNSINLCSNGVVPVAVFGSEDFDVTEIDTTTLSLAGSGVKVVGKKDKQLCSYEYVNSDSHTDLVCHFIMIDLASEDGTTTSVNLIGNLLDGSEISGSDTVYIVKGCE